MQIPLWQHQHFNRLVLSVLIAGLWFVFGALNAFANANLNLGSSANQTTPTVLIVGDSLSAEYGLARGTGWIQLMRKQASDEKISVNLVNASISGDTTSGGRSRLAALLKQHQPKLIIIEYNFWLGKEKSITMPYQEDYSWDGNIYFGASLLALNNLANKKNYSLINRFVLVKVPLETSIKNVPVFNPPT